MVCPSPPHRSLLCQVSFKKWRSADSCIPIKQMCQPQLEHCGNDLQCKRSIGDQVIATAHRLYYYLCAVARICSMMRSSRSDRVKRATARAELHFTQFTNGRKLDRLDDRPAKPWPILLRKTSQTHRTHLLNSVPPSRHQEMKKMSRIIKIQASRWHLRDMFIITCTTPNSHRALPFLHKSTSKTHLQNSQPLPRI